MERSMVHSGRNRLVWAVVGLLYGCNFPQPADVGGEAGPADASQVDSTLVDGGVVDAPQVDAMPDAPDPPGTAIQVSPTGDDSNDGFTMPVKTLKHAIGLAAANSDIIHIVLASGRYSAATGETFPYTVPPSVTVIGPAGGGATLAGTKAEPGLSLNGSGLQDVDLADFTTAITAAGTATLKNVRVLTSAVGLQAETAARVMSNTLEIAGAAGACAKGVILIGSARFAGAVFTTRNLGTTLESRDHSVSTIGNANILGDKGCTQSLALFRVTSDASFTLTESLLDGGPTGMLLNPPIAGFVATISSTIIRNMKVNAIGGGAPVGVSMTFQMTGGEVSNNPFTAVDVGDGTWTFTNVTFRQNGGAAVYLQNAHLVMRGCTITGNGNGIDVFDNSTADLGTSLSPGNNTLQGNTNVGLLIDGASGGATLVNAVGNTWNPDKQGADHNGHYSTTETVTTPTPFVRGNNYAINAGWSLSR
jgi:hypothetical protein